jgi:hypothetical protein
LTPLYPSGTILQPGALYPSPGLNYDFSKNPVTRKGLII